MRRRDQILDSLERGYRDAFEAARARGDESAMESLELRFHRDQVQMEVLLDIRELLQPEAPPAAPGETVSGLLDTAQKIRRLTRLR
ncbi:MAG: hypothetical protein RQ751_01255 [Longimicrobiales bacterium]|nr:hypothetical protein [Longimicrobiales bacterium]